MSRHRTAALITNIETDDLVTTPEAANDNDDFDAFASDVVAILLQDGLKLLAG
ncbi:hypothetical protein [Reyranella sp. CPCC 100927]|uniref:hypothetical protein n=1 Tax=Reyranella sp. CPCC 100927 TaxID=2599616 RepID=UPI0015B68CD2|nr:hypothetical protein [Reyranella sp. CPCC 100927]